MLPGGQNQFSFTVPAAPNIVGVEIRYAVSTTSPPSWADMTPLHAGWITESPWRTPVPGNGRYIFAARTRSTSNLLSVTDIRINATISRTTDTDTGTEGAFIFRCPAVDGWPGTRTGLTVGVTGDLVGESVVTAGAYVWDDLTTWDAWTTWGGGTGTGYARMASYTTPVLDLGATNTWTFRWSGTVSGGTDTVQIRTADSESALATAEWQTPTLTPITARYAQVRWMLAGDGSEQLRLGKDLCYSLGGSDVEEHLILDTHTSAWEGSASSGRRVPDHPFAFVSDILLSLQSVSAGWTWAVKTKSPPVVQIWNGAGAPSDALVDVILRGLR